MIELRVKLFSHLKYHFGQDELIISFDGKPDSDQLRARIDRMCEQININTPYRLAVNHSFISQKIPLNKDDEIAVIPPVQGG